MDIDRRQFVTTSSLAVLAGILGGTVRLDGRQAATATKFEDLRGGVGTFTGQGGTIGWLAAPGGGVIVDSQYPATARVCLDGLKSRSSDLLLVLFNTHHHGDHTAGNQAFRREIKKIVAHGRVPELQKMAARAAGNEAAQAYADTTFAESWKLDLGHETVSARHYGPAHTGGDSVITFAQADIVHVGDLVFNRLHPYVDRPAGASIANWIKVLEQIAGDHGEQTIYVFGHGKEGVGVTGAKADVLGFRDYLSALLDLVKKGVALRQSRDEIIKTETVPGFADYAAPSPRMRLADVLSLAYDELTAQAPRL